METRRFGDEEQGFSLGREPPDVVRVCAWGFWSKALAGVFAAEVIAELKKAPPRLLELDATRLKPQRPEGQDALRQVASALQPLGTAGGILFSNVLTKLQLSRIFLECGATGFRFQGVDTR
jgi:hypothetical protein